MYWCPEVCIYTQKSTRIWKVYLNYSKCTWKVSILLYYHHAIIESRATRHSAVSAFTETVEFLERSLASCLWDIAAAWLAVIFSRHNRFAETHSYLQLSYQITDRLLAAGNNELGFFCYRIQLDPPLPWVLYPGPGDGAPDRGPYRHVPLSVHRRRHASYPRDDSSDQYYLR